MGENPNNISGGPHAPGNSNNNYSYSGNGIFVGDQSHKSISDKERTPTHGTEPKQLSTQLKINNKKDASPIEDKDEEALNTNSCNSKGKNPYYFTFFNEKNDQPSNNGDAAEQQHQERSFDASNKP